MSAITFHEVLDRLGLVDPYVYEDVVRERDEARRLRAQEQQEKEQERREKEQEQREKEHQRRITAKRMMERGFGAEDIAFFCDVPPEQIDGFMAEAIALTDCYIRKI